MVPTDTNLALVKRLYDAFAETDIIELLTALHDDIEWVMPGPPEILPFAGTWKGRESVGRLLAVLAGTLVFELFEPRRFLADGDTVVVTGHSRDRMLATGRIVEIDWVAIIEVRDGKVVRYQVYEDTAAFVAALEPIPA